MDKVTYSIEGGIARITMDDGKANAMNWKFFEEIEHVLNLLKKELSERA